jgi:hypothetical protein
MIRPQSLANLSAVPASEFTARYAQIRQRWSKAVEPEPAPSNIKVRLLNAPAPVKPKLPPIAVEYVPLDMLKHCSWRFLVGYAALRKAVPVRRILSERRDAETVSARNLAMGLIYQHTQSSLPMVGRVFRRDHTTVLHGLRKVGMTTKLVDLAPQFESMMRPKVCPAPGFDAHRAKQPEAIMREVADEFGITMDELRSARRHRATTRARETAAYRLRTETAMSYPQIGQIMGHDHSTVIKAIGRYMADHPEQTAGFIV